MFMETLTIKPPKGVTLNDARIALERLNFEIVENQEYTISDSYKNELHDRSFKRMGIISRNRNLFR